jgi:putative salt-induced outer membrane protein
MRPFRNKEATVKRTLGSFLLLVLAAAGAASGQTADCPCPVPAPPAPLWFGKAEVSYLSTSGNTDTSSFGGGLEVNYNPNPWLFTLKGAGLKSATDGVTTAESFAASLRASRELTERIDVFVNAGWLRNRFSGINNIYNFDAGAGYKLFAGPEQFLRAEAAVGYSSEQDILLGIIVPYRNYANARAGLGYKWQFTKTAAFSNDFNFLVDLSDTANWFMTDKAAITAAISKIFSLQASWTLLYRNQPVPGFHNTDTATAVGLLAKF